MNLFLDTIQETEKIRNYIINDNMFIYSKTKVQKSPKTKLIIDYYKVIYDYYYYINTNHICVRIYCRSDHL